MSCKFLPIIKEVINSLMSKLVDSHKGKLQKIIAVAIETSVGDDKVESDFVSEISSYFAPVMVVSDDEDDVDRCDLAIQ